jgi:hypothetical protein
VTRHADARRRAERAERLYGMGRTWTEIADVLGYRSRQAAQQAVGRLDRDTPPETREQMRRVEDAELRHRRSMLWEMAWDARRRGDDDAVMGHNRELDRISVRRSKMFGLDEPERSAVDVRVDQSPAAIAQRAEADFLAVDAARPRPPVIDAEIVKEDTA